MAKNKFSGSRRFDTSSDVDESSGSSEPSGAPVAEQTKSETKPDIKPEAPVASVKPPAELKTPGEWAALTGNFTARNAKLPQARDVFSAPHAAAAVLYGWDHDAHHNQAELAFKLSKGDYSRALSTAVNYPSGPVHEPAIAPSCPHAQELRTHVPKRVLPPVTAAQVAQESKARRAAKALEAAAADRVRQSQIRRARASKALSRAVQQIQANNRGI